LRNQIPKLLFVHEISCLRAVPESLTGTRPAMR
jgi:hypothetical protein